MKKNVGVIDQISRIVIGAVGVYAGYHNHSYFWYVVGGLAILSGLFSFCPLYSLVGLNTSESSSDKKSI